MLRWIDIYMHVNTMVPSGIVFYRPASFLNPFRFYFVFCIFFVKISFIYGIEKALQPLSCKALAFYRGTRTRTRDLRFWRPLFYQLNYTPIYDAYLYYYEFFEMSIDYDRFFAFRRICILVFVVL